MGEIGRARELDPITIETSFAAAGILYYARRYDAAIAEAQKALDMDPNFPLAYRFLGRAALEKGLYEDAIAAFRRGTALRSARR